MLHEWNPKFEFLHDFFLKMSKQIGRASRENIIWHVSVHPFAKFEMIWKKLHGIRSFEKKYMKFGNFNLEILHIPKFEHVITITPMKYDHACP